MTNSASRDDNLGVRQHFERAFEHFLSGDYARELDEIEPAFYSAAKLNRDPHLRFRRDIPPFLGAGRLDGQNVVVTFGLNPKRNHEKDPPGSAEDYYQAALNAFSSGVPSSHHKLLLELLAEIFGAAWRSAWNEQYATFDMVPWYAHRWAVSRLTKARVRCIRPHLAVCADLLRSMSPRLVVFNGRLWVDLLQLDPPLFASPFRQSACVDYARVDPRVRHGAVLVGDICLAGENPVPAIVLACFIHQARPPLSFPRLRSLGELTRKQLGDGEPG